MRTQRGLLILLLGAAAFAPTPVLAAAPPGEASEAGVVRAELERLRREAPALVKRRKEPAAVSQLLRAMVEVDQRARKLAPDAQGFEVMRAVDAHHLPILKRLVAELGWFEIGRYGEGADRDGWRASRSTERPDAPALRAA